MPVVWIVGLLIYFILTKNKKRKKISLILTITGFWFFSNKIIFDEFMRTWEVDGISYEETKNYDIGIVPGGMISYNNDLKRIVFHRGSDRIFQAVKLYKLGKIKKILITGDSGDLYEDGLDEAEQLKAYLVSIGLHPYDIIIETKSKNTQENAEFTAELLKNEYPHFTSYLLITSAFHMKRAEGCFKEAGLDVDVFATDHYTGERWFNFERLFVPSLKTLFNWNILTKEWSGYIVYKLMGYL